MITTIEFDEHIFHVDVEETEEYYKNHSLCDCDYCLNYYSNIKGKFPELEQFLYMFGIDIAKPDETWSVELGEYIEYISTDYTVCGTVEKAGELRISEGLPFKIVVTQGFVSPNEQTGEYFTISVDGIKLPYGKS